MKLAKTDLTAELVKEFTELQGVIGGLYARAQGLGERVALAIYEQYTPASTEGADSGIGRGPGSGTCRPDADHCGDVRHRQRAHGIEGSVCVTPCGQCVVKILAEAGLPLTLGNVLFASGVEGENKAQVKEFLRERVQFYLRDVRGFAYDVVNAALAVSFDDVRDAMARAEALTAARGSEDFVAVSAAFKRIKNILHQAEEKGYGTTTLFAGVG